MAHHAPGRGAPRPARIWKPEGTGHAGGHGRARARRSRHADVVVRSALRGSPARRALDRQQEYLRPPTAAREVMQPFQRTAAVFDIDDSLLDGNAGTIFT